MTRPGGTALPGRAAVTDADEPARLAADREALRDALRGALHALAQAEHEIDELRRGIAGATEAPGTVPAVPGSDALLKLQVAVRRLGQARDRAQAIAALEEITITVLGCERYVLLELGAGASPGRVLAAMGPAVAMTDEARATAMISGAVLQTGGPVLGAAGTMPAACVPLFDGGRAVAALVLHELLPQKPALDAGDRALLNLLADVGGRAMGRGTSAAHPARGA